MPEIEEVVAAQPSRRRLPDERKAIVHHFNVGGYEGYLIVGFYEEGSPGEIFITTAKEGSTVSGLMDCFATAVSLALERAALEFPSYDRPRMTAELQRRGWTGNHKRTYRLMREDNLLCLWKRKFVVTMDSGHRLTCHRL